MSINEYEATTVSRDFILMSLSNIAHARSILPEYCFRDKVYIDESGSEVVMKEIQKGAHIEADKLLSFIEGRIFGAEIMSDLSSINLIIYGQRNVEDLAGASVANKYTRETYTIELDIPFCSRGLDEDMLATDEHFVSATQAGENLFSLIRRLSEVTSSLWPLYAIESFEVCLGVEREPALGGFQNYAESLPYQTRVRQNLSSKEEEAFLVKQQPALSFKYDKSVPENDIG